MASENETVQSTISVLGNPPGAISRFFEDIGPEPKRVLDIGCDRGRDAFFVASLGHEVVAVDQSLKQIRDLDLIARQEKLNLTVEIANVVSFEPQGMFDVIIIDHNLGQLTQYDRLRVFTKMSDFVHVGGWLLVAEGKDNLQHFRQILGVHKSRWVIDGLKGGYLFACLIEE